MIHDNPVSPVLHYLAFEVNNHGTLMMQQIAGVNHAVKVYTQYPDGINEADSITIEPGDMVMLLNLYRYVKRNDIQNDFINPHGKNSETPRNHSNQATDEKPVYTWYARTVHHRPENITITGKTLQLAAFDNAISLVYSAVNHTHSISGAKLNRLYYDEGILGGHGGVVATIAYHDDVTDRDETADAWIYADRDYSPKQ